MKLLYPYWLREAWRYHQQGHKSLWGARVELDIAMRKLGRSIFNIMKPIMGWMEKHL